MLVFNASYVLHNNFIPYLYMAEGPVLHLVCLFAVKVILVLQLFFSLYHILSSILSQVHVNFQDA